MTPHQEREIFIKASRGREILDMAIQTFQVYVRDDVPGSSPDYYRAKNLLKEGKEHLEDAIREAKKLLGPIPVYAPREYEEWRTKALEDNRIVVHGESPDELKAQLAGDEFIKGLMTEAEIEAYVRDHFETQRSGKRKLANIKVRMMLDKLSGLADEGLALQKAAQRKHQGLPPV